MVVDSEEAVDNVTVVVGVVDSVEAVDIVAVGVALESQSVPSTKLSPLIVAFPVGGLPSMEPINSISSFEPALSRLL